MKMYNSDTDQLIANIRPYYHRGFVLHYIAKDVDTGKQVKISTKDIKGFQDVKYVDVDWYRGACDLDDFLEVVESKY